jgi:predicted nuclease of predicted toxin-antitoxin system
MFAICLQVNEGEVHPAAFRMKFLIDAQLPLALAHFIRWKGTECLHVCDLPLKDRTPDSEIRRICVLEGYILITKDRDFLDTHLLRAIPAKLLLISTGNISNRILLEIMKQNWQTIKDLFGDARLIELDNSELITHF